VGAKVRIRFGKPIPREPGDHDTLLATTHAEIADTLAAWNGAEV
jgi:hypothetical protein